MATLKISDLSVGDWVSCEDVYCKVEYILPDGIIGTTCRNYRDGYENSLTNLRPIPITAEILEKIGFEDNCGRWYNSEALMEFEQYEDGWCRTINCGEYSVYFIKYVHQLQHAIRLAGIDEEIVL